jgi:hypothetical protein
MDTRRSRPRELGGRVHKQVQCVGDVRQREFDRYGGATVDGTRDVQTRARADKGGLRRRLQRQEQMESRASRPEQRLRGYRECERARLWCRHKVTSDKWHCTGDVVLLCCWRGGSSDEEMVQLGLELAASQRTALP